MRAGLAALGAGFLPGLLLGLLAVVTPWTGAATATGQTYVLNTGALNAGVAEVASVGAAGSRLSGAVGDTFAAGTSSGNTYSLGGGFVGSVFFPVGVVSPTSLSFASQVLGTPSAAQPVTVSNLGAALLSLGSPGVTGDFIAQGNTCGAALAAGQSCIINLVFTPTATGARTGALSLGTNAPGGTLAVALAGTGQTAGGGGGGGGGNDGDVPLPAWAHALLAAGLMAALLRRRRSAAMGQPVGDRSGLA
jgi:hypothetical protein